jgi:LacI family transcriptional regulator
VAAERSWQMMLSISGDKPEMEHAALLRLMTARVDGIIFAPTANPLPETQELVRRTNAVQLLRHHDNLPTPVIAMDERYGITRRSSTCVNWAIRVLATSVWPSS